MAPTNYSSTSSLVTSRPNLNGQRSPTNANGSGLNRKKILLLGMRRAGKTSIQQVLFNSLPPKQTFYLETTMRINKIPIDTVIPLEVWDCPANTTVESLGVPLSQFSTIIFVIDIRDLYNQPISKLVEFIVASSHDKPDIFLEVFVHKAEKLQEDDKLENFRQIHERVSDRLLDISPEYEEMELNFHLTSVYDHSLHEAFSRVLHKLIDSLPYLEDLLNVFCANSQSPKAFLFDTNSRLYIATDASPVDSATHNLCSDYLQMLNAFGPLYRSITASPNRQRQLGSGPGSGAATAPGTPLPRTPPPSAVSSAATTSPNSSQSPAQSRVRTYPSLGKINSETSLGSSSGSGSGARSSSPRTQMSAKKGSGANGAHHRPPGVSSPLSPPPQSPSTSAAPALSPTQPTSDEPKPVIPPLSTSSLSSSSLSTLPQRARKPKDLFYPSASTTLSLPSLAHPSGSGPGGRPGSTSGGVSPLPWPTSTQTPSSTSAATSIISTRAQPSRPPTQTNQPSTTVTYHLITPHLALLALVPTVVFREKRGLLEYNVVFFREGVQEICDVEEEGRG